MSPNENDEQPIFIVGSVRSGTSVVARALTQGAKIPGYREGCFLQYLGGFIAMVEADQQRRKRQLYSRHVMVSTLNTDDLFDSFSRWFKGEYEKLNKHSGTWVDKTANSGAIEALPYALKLWPQAKVIHMRRRVFENSMSRTRKFPHVTRQAHIHQWAHSMETWETVRAQLPATQVCEIDQYELVLDPKAVAHKLGMFLSLDDDQMKNMTTIFTRKKPEKTARPSITYDMDDLEFTLEEQKLFKKRCTRFMKEYNWSLDKKYYRER